MRTWDSDHPKAALMMRKRDVIVSAALRAFLEEGYEGSSVNRIAEDAGVSIKTLYRHFTGKDDLFAAVMAAACAPPKDPDGDTDAPWLKLPPDEALPMMAESYLRDVFPKDQIALYRVVARDSAHFPAIGRMYHAQIIERRLGHFVRYAERWAAPCGWPIGDWRHAAEVFAGLLDAGFMNAALLLNHIPEEDMLVAHAERTASDMLFMIASGRFASASSSLGKNSSLEKEGF
jgi:AcrR family transcriptional regulator